MFRYQINRSLIAIAALMTAIVFFFSAGTSLHAQTPDTTKQQPAGGGGGGNIVEGSELFANNCKQCHAVWEKVVGPQLSNVTQRRTVPWLVNFIKYPERTIKSGDAYAVALYNEYKQYMPNHDFLKDEQIKSIIAYIDDETKKGPPKDKDSQGEKGGATAEAGGSSGVMSAVLIGMTVLLVVLLSVLILLAAVLRRYLQKDAQVLSEADKEVLAQEFSFGEIIRSRAFVTVVTFLFVAIVSKAAVDGMISIGVQQGYAPTQPIAFSHKLHAGEYEIQCQYCHTGVEKGRSANIPSANICMNCHNTIKTTSPEIQKIYEHIQNDQPIQWVRIHNLPDLSYFNHAQHVKVGGVQCESCHGDIKKMEVVQQVSLLTMGWCIDCHRKTDVSSKGNAYYDKLVKMHSAYSKEPMKVEDIGGLECSKCHY